jgi:hypothetical protein
VGVSPVRTKLITTFLFIGLVIFISSQFLSAIDTPHNDSKGIYSCEECHGKDLLDTLKSPFWGGSEDAYDLICITKCHKTTSAPYPEQGSPLVKTHSSENTSTKHGVWKEQCRDCHDPHYQLQKNYKITDPNNYYLAKGTITSCVYNGDGTSKLTYSSITYRSGEWDANKLSNKTTAQRGAILLPNVGKLGFNYPITAIDETSIPPTITVTGNACTNLYPPSNFAVIYGQLIRDSILVNKTTGEHRPVKLFDKTGTNSFADGDTTYNGVCEVCHTQTIFHTNNASSDHTHYAANNCMLCHSHTEGLKGSGDCIACHSSSITGRAAITPQFNANSHHVQGVTLTNAHCYQCHWEAKPDGSLNNDYHMSGKVDLVIYGAGTRPTTYALGTTAIQYTANGTRSEIQKINSHCLGCHSTKNNSATPFGDGKTPKQYAWDSKSIDERYSQTGTTKWGKEGISTFINESFEKNPGYD